MGKTTGLLLFAVVLGTQIQFAHSQPNEIGPRIGEIGRHESAQLAQSLPGPASGGWFVMMGVPVSYALEYGQPKSPQSARELEAAKRDYARMVEQTLGKCVAAIVPSQIASNAYAPIDRGGMNLIRATRLFGPYPNQASAHQQLMQAGWTAGRPSNNAVYPLYHSSSGC